MNAKLMYVLGSARSITSSDRQRCPSCGHERSIVVDRKHLFMTLRRCGQCHLLYRSPTTGTEAASDNYQTGYQEGFTTEMPTTAELRTFTDSGFVGTDRDHSDRIAVLDALGCKPGVALLDFGCSWGYGSWQLAQRGYDVTAIEVSKPRAEYARKNLGVNVVASPGAELGDGTFDVFFASHVIEHVPEVSAVLDLAFRLLVPGGLLVLFTPNGTRNYRRLHPRAWHTYWGFWHVALPDEVFLDAYFAKVPRLLASIPYDLAGIREARLEECGSIQLGLGGPELLFVARKTPLLLCDWHT